MGESLDKLVKLKNPEKLKNPLEGQGPQSINALKFGKERICVLLYMMPKTKLSLKTRCDVLLYKKKPFSIGLFRLESVQECVE